jgi:hypothetical protein
MRKALSAEKIGEVITILKQMLKRLFKTIGDIIVANKIMPSTCYR